MINFKHQPKLGDIIYSLPLIRKIKETTGEDCNLFLDPISPFFKGQKAIWTKQFEWLAPLIKDQEYINECKIYNGESIDYDLDKYMNTSHLTNGDRTSIVENHFKAFDVPFVKGTDDRKWLVASSHKYHPKVIISRSGNYHSKENYKQVLEEYPIGERAFVGTLQEAQNFISDTRTFIQMYRAKSAKDLTNIINESNLFVGNQSLPLAIALGLGKKCLVEESEIYPNCIVGDYEAMK